MDTSKKIIQSIAACVGILAAVLSASACDSGSSGGGGEKSVQVTDADRAKAQEAADAVAVRDLVSKCHTEKQGGESCERGNAWRAVLDAAPSACRDSSAPTDACAKAFAERRAGR